MPGLEKRLIKPEAVRDVINYVEGKKINNNCLVHVFITCKNVSGISNIKEERNEYVI
jgi:hypothetical protein